MLCDLNGEALTIPNDLVETESIFKSVISAETWNNLTQAERTILKEYLPPSFEDQEEEQEKTISLLFEDTADNNFKFGNPLTTAYNKIKGGYLNPATVAMKTKCKELKKKEYKISQKKYYRNLLQDIIVSRQDVLDQIYKGTSPTLPKRSSYPQVGPNCLEKAEKRYKKLLNNVSQDSGDKELSSDEEIIEDKKPVQGLQGMGEDTFQSLIKDHHKRRAIKEIHPELDTTNLSIADVIMRCSGIIKKPAVKKVLKKKVKSKVFAQPHTASETKPKLTSTATITSKSKDEKKEKKNPNKIDTHNEDDDDVNFKEKESVKLVKTSNRGFPKMSCFFSLIGFFFEKEREKKCSMAKIQEEIALWQTHRSSENCGWKTLYSNWLPLIPYAVDYLLGQGSGKQLPDFIPLLIPEGDKEWVWTGPDYMDDEVIVPLCNHWLETLNSILAANKKTEEFNKKQDLNLKAVSVVLESTEQQRADFRLQEKERYESAYKAYVYKMTKENGEVKETVVGPVKGVHTLSDMDTCKAREHTILVNERPAYVTILCLVRDAVARLPEGEGTRVDVCTMLKDSQFLNTEASDSQVHTVCSGAMDRLHAEKDPCVKFDSFRKVWVYLHMDRTPEQFEKLHAATAAAALAKKQMSKKSQKRKSTSSTLIDQESSDNKVSQAATETKTTTSVTGIVFASPTTTTTASTSSSSSSTSLSSHDQQQSMTLSSSSSSSEKKKVKNQSSKRKRSSGSESSNAAGVTNNKHPKLLFAAKPQSTQQRQQQPPTATPTLESQISETDEALLATQSISLLGGGGEGDDVDIFVDGYDVQTISSSFTNNTVPQYIPPVAPPPISAASEAVSIAHKSLLEGVKDVVDKQAKKSKHHTTTLSAKKSSDNQPSTFATSVSVNSLITQPVLSSSSLVVIPTTTKSIGVHTTKASLIKKPNNNNSKKQVRSTTSTNTASATQQKRQAMNDDTSTNILIQPPTKVVVRQHQVTGNSLGSVFVKTGDANVNVGGPGGMVSPAPKTTASLLSTTPTTSTTTTTSVPGAISPSLAKNTKRSNSGLSPSPSDLISSLTQQSKSNNPKNTETAQLLQQQMAISKAILLQHQKQKQKIKPNVTLAQQQQLLKQKLPNITQQQLKQLQQNQQLLLQQNNLPTSTGAVDKAVRPQFFLTTKPTVGGKQTVVSLHQVVNNTNTKKTTAFQSVVSLNTTTTTSKSSLITNANAARKQQTLIAGGKPIQANTGVALGNMSMSTIQTLNKLIASSSTAATPSSAVKQQRGGSMSLKTIPISIPTTSSKTTRDGVTSNFIKQGALLSSSGAASSANNRKKIPTIPTSPRQQQQNSQNSILQQFIALNSKNNDTNNKQQKFMKAFPVSPSHHNIASSLPLKKMKITSPVTTAPPPSQTLSLNQLVAAARANLQTTKSVRPQAPTTTLLSSNINISNNTIRSAMQTNNTTTTTLQALLQVVQKQNAAGVVTPSAQLLIQPKLASAPTGGSAASAAVSGSEPSKLVRFPKAAVVGNPRLSSTPLMNNTNALTNLTFNNKRVVTPGKTPSTAPRGTVFAPLKISLPKTAAFAGSSINAAQTPPHTVGASSFQRGPANIVFSSPNLIITGRNNKMTSSSSASKLTPNSITQQNSEKKS